jgi:hypothetical protein
MEINWLLALILGGFGFFPLVALLDRSAPPRRPIKGAAAVGARKRRRRRHPKLTTFIGA